MNHRYTKSYVWISNTCWTKEVRYQNSYFMTLLIWNSRNNNLICNDKNRSVADWSWMWGWDWLGKGAREVSGAINVFYSLTVTQLSVYICQNSSNYILKMGVFIVCKLCFNKIETSKDRVFLRINVTAILVSFVTKILYL